jgi:hypothetical protein
LIGRFVPERHMKDQSLTMKNKNGTVSFGRSRLVFSLISYLLLSGKKSNSIIAITFTGSLPDFTYFFLFDLPSFNFTCLGRAIAAQKTAVS